MVWVRHDKDSNVVCGPVVERKTVADLIKSARDGRLWRQIRRMQSTGVEARLLIEGELDTEAERIASFVQACAWMI